MVSAPLCALEVRRFEPNYVPRSCLEQVASNNLSLCIYVSSIVYAEYIHTWSSDILTIEVAKKSPQGVPETDEKRNQIPMMFLKMECDIRKINFTISNQMNNPK